MSCRVIVVGQRVCREKGCREVVQGTQDMIIINLVQKFSADLRNHMSFDYNKFIGSLITAFSN
jgi:hypothetical protein